MGSVSQMFLHYYKEQEICEDINTYREEMISYQGFVFSFLWQKSSHITYTPNAL